MPDYRQTFAPRPTFRMESMEETRHHFKKVGAEPDFSFKKLATSKICRRIPSLQASLESGAEDAGHSGNESGRATDGEGAVDAGEGEGEVTEKAGCGDADLSTGRKGGESNQWAAMGRADGAEDSSEGDCGEVGGETLCGVRT